MIVGETVRHTFIIGNGHAKIQGRPVYFLRFSST